MTKLCLIGAGSTIFAKKLIGDFLLTPELKELSLALHDSDAARLKTSTIVAQCLMAATGRTVPFTATLGLGALR